MGGHIVITGPMGCGKTTVGELLAKKLGRPFLDTDRDLESVESRTAREVAESDGVAFLHSRERTFLADALGRTTPVVIAAAASVGDDETLLRQALADGHDLIFLAPPAERIPDLARRGRHRRPIAPEEAIALYLDRRRTAALAGAQVIETREVVDAAALVAEIRTALDR